MSSLQQDIDDLDRMVDTDAAKDAIRSQIRLIAREVSTLQADFARLEQEHQELQASQTPTPSQPPLQHLRGVYYASGDLVPFCPYCYETDNRRIHLSGPVALFDSTMERWDCHTCNTAYGAKPNENFLPRPRKT